MLNWEQLIVRLFTPLLFLCCTAGGQKTKRAHLRHHGWYCELSAGRASVQFTCCGWNLCAFSRLFWACVRVSIRAIWFTHRNAWSSSSMGSIRRLADLWSSLVIQSVIQVLWSMQMTRTNWRGHYINVSSHSNFKNGDSPRVRLWVDQRVTRTWRRTALEEARSDSGRVASLLCQHPGVAPRTRVHQAGQFIHTFMMFNEFYWRHIKNEVCFWPLKQKNYQAITHQLRSF